MNTAIDMLLALPFVALLTPGMRWIFWASAVAGALVAEFFSTFPFGLLSLVFFGGWLFVRALLTFFDTSSLASLVIAFLVGVGIETFLIICLFIFDKGGVSSTLMLRGGIFAMRQFLAGLFVFSLIMGVRAAYAVAIYALAEEKNPFA